MYIYLLLDTGGGIVAWPQLTESDYRSTAKLTGAAMGGAAASFLGLVIVADVPILLIHTKMALSNVRAAVVSMA